MAVHLLLRRWRHSNSTWNWFHVFSYKRLFSFCYWRGILSTSHLFSSLFLSQSVFPVLPCGHIFPPHQLVFDIWYAIKLFCCFTLSRMCDCVHIVDIYIFVFLECSIYDSYYCYFYYFNNNNLLLFFNINSYYFVVLLFNFFIVRCCFVTSISRAKQIFDVHCGKADSNKVGCFYFLFIKSSKGKLRI